jgi:hypothetical protein
MEIDVKLFERRENVIFSAFILATAKLSDAM